MGRQEGGRLLFVPGEGLPCAGLEPDPMLKLSARTAWLDFPDLWTTKACSCSDFADHGCGVEWEEGNNGIWDFSHWAIWDGWEWLQRISAEALGWCAGRLQGFPTCLTHVGRGLPSQHHVYEDECCSSLANHWQGTNQFQQWFFPDPVDISMVLNLDITTRWRCTGTRLWRSAHRLGAAQKLNSTSPLGSALLRHSGKITA